MAQPRSGADRRRDLGVAAAFLVAGVVLYIGDLRYFFGPTSLVGALPQWLPLMSLTIACVFQCFRSTRPDVALAGTVAALIIDAFSGPTIAVWIVYSDVVYAVAMYGSARLQRVLLLVNSMIAAIALTVALTASGDWRVALLAMLLVTALIVSPASYGHAIRQHRSAADSERERAKALEELALRDREAAVSGERRRLARELHDVVAGQLSGIALQSAAALASHDLQARDSVLRSVRASSLEALGEMRTMIELLSGPGDLDAPVTATLDRVDRLFDGARAAGSTVTADVEPTRLTPVSDIVAYRIVQQALTNATTHSPGSAIDVSVRQGPSAATVTVTNAVPPDTPRPGAGHGQGIANMRVRAQSVGGTFEVAVTGGHWRVAAELPTPTVDQRPDATP